MAYITCHARKVKTLAGLSSIASLNSREKVYDFNPSSGQVSGIKAEGILPACVVAPERAGLNYGTKGAASQTLIRREEEIKAAALKRLPQKNASLAVEFGLSASPDWFVERPDQDIKRLLDEYGAFIKEKFGHVIQENYLFDEKTPIARIICVPILENRYTSSEFLGGRGGLRVLQQEIYERIGKKRGMTRGAEELMKVYDGQILITQQEKRALQVYKMARDGLARKIALPDIKPAESAASYKARVEETVLALTAGVDAEVKTRIKEGVEQIVKTGLQDWERKYIAEVKKRSAVYDNLTEVDLQKLIAEMKRLKSATITDYLRDSCWRTLEQWYELGSDD